MTPIRHPELMTRNIDNEVVILDRRSGWVHQLNATASCIWHYCDGSSSIDSIAERVSADFEVDAETALKDVETCVREFQSLGLLSESR